MSAHMIVSNNADIYMRMREIFPVEESWHVSWSFSCMPEGNCCVTGVALNDDVSVVSSCQHSLDAVYADMKYKKELLNNKL